MDSLPSPPLLSASTSPRPASANLSPRLSSARRVGWERGGAQCRAEKEASGSQVSVESESEEARDGGAMRWRGDDDGDETDTDHSESAGRERRRERRTFSKGVREECWGRAAMVEGRDGERWRRDAVGNIVFRPLLGCNGPLCFDFDHILPFAKGGASSIDNCQVLQVSANRAKGSAVSDSWRQEAAHLNIRQPSTEHMDVLELAAYGDMCHGTTRYVLHSPACDRLLHPSSTSTRSKVPAGSARRQGGNGSRGDASTGGSNGCSVQ